MSHDLLDALQDLGHPRILVVGDAILDRYIWGDAERVSQEAPVILLRADRDEARLGGAANVAHMLRGLEADVSLATVVGRDSHALALQQELHRAGISPELVIEDPSRPTTVKERFIGRAQNRHPHQMLRVDREVRDPLSRGLEQTLLDSVLPAIDSYSAFLISDYGKGVCTSAVVGRLISRARAAGVPVVVDPRPGSDYGLYRGATAVTPNRLESRLATGIEIRSPEDAFSAGRRLCHDLELDHAYITLDSDGMALVRSDGRAELLTTRRRAVYDITGAGDMVLATIGIGLAERLDPRLIARLANVAGGLEVERMGVVPVTRSEMLADIFAHQRLSA
jgi:D-beta-D-heptose 7-phosphate kinase/D-beta-D-heptose 1-phosphate adenosyltransferase